MPRSETSFGAARRRPTRSRREIRALRVEDPSVGGRRGHPRRGHILTGLLAVAAALAWVGQAIAVDPYTQNLRTRSSNYNGEIAGVKSGITSPSGYSMPAAGQFGATVWADNNVGGGGYRGIQVGLHALRQYVTSGNGIGCANNSSVPEMGWFAEVWTSSGPHCYEVSLAGTNISAEPWAAAIYDPGLQWLHLFNGGNPCPTGCLRTSWSECGGTACRAIAMSEHIFPASAGGGWTGRFGNHGGVGGWNAPWQIWVAGWNNASGPLSVTNGAYAPNWNRLGSFPSSWCFKYRYPISAWGTCASS